MDEKEVDALVKEAEAKRDEDKKKKEMVEARNMADSTVHQAEQFISDNKDKISEADKTDIEGKLVALKAVLGNTGSTKDQIDEASKPLNEVMMKVGQQMYSQPGADAGASGAAGSGSTASSEAGAKDDD
jgi:molecular chaperone DnaK